ncbi:g8314 [Coccomyxa elongata]
MGGVQEQLNAWLLRWNHDLDGVMLSYSNAVLESTEARIHPYFPYFHVDVTADVHLFSPAPGYVITGRVNKIGADYIGLLILGVFNAAIGHQNIRAEFQHSAADNSWVSRKKSGHRIEEGTDVIFTVHTVQNEGDFFSLTGKLDGAWTGAVGHTAPQIPDEEHRKKKKRKAEAADLRAEARPHTQQPTANHLTKHKRPQAASAALPAAAAPATALQTPAAAIAGPAASAAKKPKKEKQQKTHGNGNLEAAAGATVKVEPQQVSAGVAAPSIKAEAPAAGTGLPEKKKKKRRDRDRIGQTDEPTPSNAGNGFQPSVKAEMKEERSPGIQSAGRREPGVKIKAEKDALGRTGGSKKPGVPGVHTSLPNGHAQHQAGHASAQGKAKKTRDKSKG